MSKTKYLTKTAVVSMVAAASMLAMAQSWASGSHSGGHGHGAMIGQAGDPKQASRTVEIKMGDNFFEPEAITVKASETVRFKVTNGGQFVHEFNIGTAAMHAAHQKEMMMMMEHGALQPDKIDHQRMKMDMGNGKTMQHNDPNSILLEPGKSGEVVWKFSSGGQVEFACNVPGHYDAGMVGKFHFK